MGSYKGQGNDGGSTARQLALAVGCVSAESTVHRLAPGASKFLEERGLMFSSMHPAYQRLVRTKSSQRGKGQS